MQFNKWLSIVVHILYSMKDAILFPSFDTSFFFGCVCAANKSHFMLNMEKQRIIHTYVYKIVLNFALKLIEFSSTDL